MQFKKYTFTIPADLTSREEIAEELSLAYWSDEYEIEAKPNPKKEGAMRIHNFSRGEQKFEHKGWVLIGEHYTQSATIHVWEDHTKFQVTAPYVWVADADGSDLLIDPSGYTHSITTNPTTTMERAYGKRTAELAEAMLEWSSR